MCSGVEMEKGQCRVWLRAEDSPADVKSLLTSPVDQKTVVILYATHLWEHYFQSRRRGRLHLCNNLLVGYS